VTAGPHAAIDAAFRKTLLECYLSLATSPELSRWLEDIGQDPKGSVDDKRQRVRAHTQYLSMPRETFPRQTLSYLSPYTADHLAEIGESLGLQTDGAKDDLFRRIYREVGYREGWLERVPAAVESFDKQLVLPFVTWYPIQRRGEYESDYYDAFEDEMVELLGEECVHPEYPVAHGSTLKIDFHIGRPQQPGVGVEFKRPTGNSELQRALGQMDQYLAAYGSNLIVVLIPDALTKAQETLFVDALRGKGIATVVKRSE
jgi:hypothetical protein